MISFGSNIFKKKYGKVFLFFIILCFLSAGSLENLCKVYVPLNFDNQVLLTWEYSASLHILPYRDIFYPYGFLNYFKSQNMLFSILNFFLSPLLFTAVFLALKSIFKDRLFSYVSFSLFFLFVLTITGFETFNRYGILVGISLLFTYIYFYGKKFFYKWLFLIGLLIGIVFSFVNDQGLYSFVLFFVFSIIDKLLKRMEKRFGFYQIVKELVVFLVGFGIGVIPFFAYLAYQYSFFQFFTYLKNLPELSLYAKAPFFHSALSIDNIFTFATLIVAVHFLVYKFLFGDKKITFNTYLQIGLIFILVILEQKSIIRSMNKQLTFIGLLLFISLFFELKVVLQRLKLPNLLIFSFYAGTLFIIFFPIALRSDHIASQYPSLKQGVKAIQAINSKACLENNKKLFSKEYIEVKEQIIKYPEFNGMILSFPSDPIFYILFNQTPPRYTNSYDGSSLTAQSDRILYMQKNNIQYVIINTKIIALQDEVPNYIRTPYEFAFILNNFKPYKRINDFLILKKDHKSDFFTNSFLNNIGDFKRSLHTINLENIPKSEGYHKRKYLSLDASKIIIMKHSLDELNNYLGKNIVDTKNKFLLLVFRNEVQKKQIYINIKTKNGLNTDVYFNSCETQTPCIINLSRLPLFYRNRMLGQITSKENDNIANVMILDIAQSSHFW